MQAGTAAPRVRHFIIMPAIVRLGAPHAPGLCLGAWGSLRRGSLLQHGRTPPDSAIGRGQLPNDVREIPSPTKKSAPSKSTIQQRTSKKPSAKARKLLPKTSCKSQPAIQELRPIGVHEGRTKAQNSKPKKQAKPSTPLSPPAASIPTAIAQQSHQGPLPPPAIVPPKYANKDHAPSCQEDQGPEPHKATANHVSPGTPL